MTILSRKATHYSAQCTPRKARLLRPLVLKQPLDIAMARLAVQRRAGAHDMLKLLKAAAAQLPTDTMSRAFVQGVVVNEGPKRRTFMPRAQGRSAMVLKRTSHITVSVMTQVL